MFSPESVIFVVCVTLIAYAYVGYPAFVWLLARVAGEPLQKTEPAPRAVSVVIAAHNEAANIQRRVRELLRLIDRLDSSSEVIIVSDGSTDGTDRLAREVGDARVRVIQQPGNFGKAAALNAGVASAHNPVIVFGDTRQEWAEDAIDRLLENLRDPDVGAVSGDLVLRNGDGTLAGVGLYWKLEKWIRRNESLLHSSVQVAGSICCVRRSLYVPIPEGTILDDVCWPQSVAMQEYRVIHEPEAHAFDRLPDKPRDEMRRKVRTLAGNFQLLFRRPAIILPWRNPAWFAVICHKLLRLVVPWAMIGALIASVLAEEPWLRVMFWLQFGGYALGGLGVLVPAAGRNRLVNAISSLLVLNAAALISWFVYFTGRSGRSWKKTTYRRPPAGVPATSST